MVFDSLDLTSVVGIGPKRSVQIMEALRKNGLSIDELVQLGGPKIKAITGVPINVANNLANTAKIHEVPDSSETVRTNSPSESFAVVDRNSLLFPTCLKGVLQKSVPEHLYMWGNLDLLCKQSIGFCGSRDVSARGLEVTRDIAEQAARRGWVVVSGHARGVDITAHRAALEHGGTTIIVAAEGIRSFKLRSELRPFVTSQNTLVISEFDPEDNWAVWRAMKRNHTIIGLATAMVLIEARSKGGTFEAGKASLKLKVPLFVANYASDEEHNEGNRYFLTRGAYTLSQRAATLRANIDPIDKIIALRSQPQPETGAKQMELFP